MRGGGTAGATLGATVPDDAFGNQAVRALEIVPRRPLTGDTNAPSGQSTAQPIIAGW